MTPGDRPRGPLTRFAGEVVGLEGLDEGETIAALFRKLRDDDFLPDPLAHEAMLALAGRPIQSGSLLGEEADASEERKLHAEVEGFASEFFAIPVASRVDRWRTLSQTCARHPGLVDRLRTLKRGLEIDRGAVNDPSPAVNRLLDDLLALFPLRPEPRAVESRLRQEQFRNDPSLTPRDRDQAKRQVLKRYPAVAALLPGDVSQLGLPRVPMKAARAKTRVFSTLHANVEDRPVVYAFLLLSIVGAVFRFVNFSRTTNPPAPAPANTALPSNTRPTVPPNTLPNLRSNPNSRAIRNANLGEIRAKLRGEILRMGRTIDENQLAKVVDGLPIDELPPVGGLGMIRLRGYWTKEVRDRFVARLVEGLEATDLELSGRELDELAAKCLPPPSDGPAPGRPPSP